MFNVYPITVTSKNDGKTFCVKNFYNPPVIK